MEDSSDRTLLAEMSAIRDEIAGLRAEATTRWDRAMEAHQSKLEAEQVRHQTSLNEWRQRQESSASEYNQAQEHIANQWQTNARALYQLQWPLWTVAVLLLALLMHMMLPDLFSGKP